MRATLAMCLATAVGWLAATTALAADAPAKPERTTAAAKASSAPARHDKHAVSVYVFNRDGKLVGPVDSPKLVLSPAQWRKRLTPEQYHVLRAKDTEAAFCGTLLDNKKEGVYSCAGCGLPLFSSSAKFDSGSGWPSFMQPVAKENIENTRDLADGMVRVEIKCMRCKGHQGHVFDDGPQPTGLRYCLNSASLVFTDHEDLAKLADPAAGDAAEVAAADPPTKQSTAAKDKTVRVSLAEKANGGGSDTGDATKEKDATLAAKPAGDAQKSKKETVMTQQAVFAGGCFWCTEAAFQQLRGVSDVESGYAGGKQSTATYEQVSSGRTGHAEVIRVTYDPAKITYDQLLMVFFDAHDPTQLNRQGADVGTQYRSAIFYAGDEQKEAAEAKIHELTEKKAYGTHRIVTKLEPLTAFYPAEGYHQDYVVNNPLQPYVRGHSIPKACAVQKRHPELLDPEKAARISALAQ